MKLPKEYVQKFVIPFGVSILLLLITIFVRRLPSAYYLCMKIIVCCTMAYFTYCAWKGKRNPIMWAYGVIAVLYNPIVTVHLNKDLFGLTIIALIILLVIEFRSYLKVN